MTRGDTIPGQQRPQALLRQVLAKHLDDQPECLPAFYFQLEGVLETWFRDSEALARTAMGPPPVDPATAHQLLREWLQLPDRHKPYVYLQLRGAPGYTCRTAFVEWLTRHLHHGLYALLTETAPDDAQRFREQAYRVMEREVQWLRESRATGVAGQMTRGLIRALPRFIEDQFASAAEPMSFIPGPDRPGGRP